MAETGLLNRIEAEAHRLGFDLVGLAPATPPTTIGHYRAWLEGGYHGEMAYLARPEAVARRGDLTLLLPGVRSVVVVAASYAPYPPSAGPGDDPGRGLLARYAWGDDYHSLLLSRLCQLGTLIEAESHGAVAFRACVDTAPLLERELAVRAGLGFIGKNTNLIHPRLGSWLFLGELLLTVDIETEQAPSAEGRSTSPCGRCTRCLDACPTGALIAPYLLDARRCISYLTIELKGPIPGELRPLLGNRIFGCDLCQEVCPWNRRSGRAVAGAASQPRPDDMAPHLLELIALDDEGFRQRFGNSPVKRAKRRGLLRNVAVALGNWGDPAAVPALVQALHDVEPLVRGHAAWALGRIATPAARRALQEALPGEADGWVQQEIQQAL